MAEKSQAGQGPKEDSYPPPPPGPPPGHNGLSMHPNETPLPDSHDELYDSPTTAQPNAAAQQTAHQPPPPDSDGAPKKVSWAQRLSALGGKAAGPFNMLANKLGSESFLPSTMDKECEKAARILKSFCKDGIYTENAAPESVEAPVTDKDGKPTTVTAKPKKNRTLLTIPSKVINRAVGLAIFTTARAGFHVSGATGSGVLVARLPDGSWSPPSGIQVHSVGAGFMIGLDIYDCVVVINTKEALEAFTRTRMSLGSDLAVVAGPWGAGGSVDFAAPSSQKAKDKSSPAGGSSSGPPSATKDAEGKPGTPTPVTEKPATESEPVPGIKEPAPDKAGAEAGTEATTADSADRPKAGKERKPSAFKQAIKQPTYSYVKSRGFYAGVQVDGTIVTERKEANATFYGEPVSVQSITKGEVPLVPGKENWVNIVKPLFDTIKGAEGWHGSQQSGGEWANQQGPAQTYGHGNQPGGHTPGFDPVFANQAQASGNAPGKPPRPDGSVAGAAEGVANMNIDGSSSSAVPVTAETPAARSKAAEAAAEAETNREREERERREVEEAFSPDGRASNVPPYTEVAGATAPAGEELPPAYAEDDTARPVRGDSKSGGHQ